MGILFSRRPPAETQWSTICCKIGVISASGSEFSLWFLKKIKNDILILPDSQRTSFHICPTRLMSNSPSHTYLPTFYPRKCCTLLEVIFQTHTSPLFRFCQAYFTARKIHEQQHHSLLTPLGPANLWRKHIPEARHSHIWHLVFHTNTRTKQQACCQCRQRWGLLEAGRRQVRREAELYRLTRYHEIHFINQN